MKDLFRFSLILTFVALIASGSLAWINKITRPKIEAQQQTTFNEGLFYVLPGSDNGVILPVYSDSTIICYKGFSNKDTSNLIGYAYPVNGNGYSSTIRTLVGIDTSGIILAIKILFQKETPGLGTRCDEILPDDKEPWFQKQFKNKNGEKVSLDKDNGEIISITGATITSKAITDPIADSTKIMLKKLNLSNQRSNL